MGTEPVDDTPYEVIKPPTTLKSKVRELNRREAAKFDPVKSAEAALNRLSANFGSWMANEAQALGTAWQAIADQGSDKDTVNALYQAAHNIKGQALTLGYPLVGQVAARFCYLLEALPAPHHLPLPLTATYVETIRAMVAEGARDEDNKTGAELLATLSDMTDAAVNDLPARENQ